MRVIQVKSDKRAREKPCLRCGYSLRRPTDSLHCPECGLSIWLSLNGNDNLDWSNPEWLHRLAISGLVMACAQIVGLLAYAGLLLPRHHLILPLPALISIGAIYVFIDSLALLVFFTHEGRYPDKWKAYRIGGRIVGGIGIFIGTALLLGLLKMAIIPSFLFGRFALEMFILSSVMATFAYLRLLARRLHRFTLAMVCGWILLAPALSLLKSMPIVSLFVFEFAGIIRYLPLIYLPATAGLLLWFALQFRRASVASAKNWTLETAGSEAIIQK